MAPECPNVPSCREPYDCLTELQFQNPICHCITASWTLADIYGLLIWNRACVSNRAGRDEGIYLVAVEMCHLKKPTLIEWIFKKVLVLEYVYLYMCNIELTIFPRCWAERVSLRVNTFPHTEISLHTPGLESSVKTKARMHYQHAVSSQTVHLSIRCLPLCCFLLWAKKILSILFE